MPQNTITYEPMTRDKFLDITKGREVWIYGAGFGGMSFSLALERNDIVCMGFIDRSDHHNGKTSQGYPVVKPECFFETHTSKNTFLVLTKSPFKKELVSMRDVVEGRGFEYNKDFLFLRDIVKLYPSIEVSGVCNFNCIACPQGSTVNPMKKGGFMSLETLDEILKKLLREIPFLLNVEPYLWGEPTLHPNLPEIIKIFNKHKTPVHISTNLNVSENLRALIEAEPDRLFASVSGFGDEKYNITQKGSKWGIFERNLRDIVSYKKEIGSKTVIYVNYHLNNSNLEEYKLLYELCQELEIKINAIDSYVFPDVVMDYLDGLSDETTELAFNLNLTDIEDELRRCQAEKEKSCLIRLALPNILYDGSVVTCCKSYRGKLADNYLDISIEELIERKNRCKHCEKCISMALHRWKEPRIIAVDEKPQRILELGVR